MEREDSENSRGGKRENKKVMETGGKREENQREEGSRI